jgi:hypothetical protein
MLEPVVITTIALGGVALGYTLLRLWNEFSSTPITINLCNDCNIGNTSPQPHRRTSARRGSADNGEPKTPREEVKK